MEHTPVNNSGITYINIDGQEISIRFGLPACQAFYEMVLAEDAEKYITGKTLKAQGIAKLLYAGYVNNCLVNDLPALLSFGRMMLYVEDTIVDDPGKLEALIKVFEDSKYTRKMAEETEKVLSGLEEEKKRLIGFTSSLLPSTNSASRRNSITHAPTESSNSKKRGTNVTTPKKQRKK